MKLILVLLSFFFLSYADENSSYSPTYIPPNLNNPYNVEPNPYKEELNELQRNIQKDLEEKQNTNNKKGNSKNNWFYDIFKSIEDMVDSLF